MDQKYTEHTLADFLFWVGFEEQEMTTQARFIAGDLAKRFIAAKEKKEILESKREKFIEKLRTKPAGTDIESLEVDEGNPIKKKENIEYGSHGHEMWK